MYPVLHIFTCVGAKCIGLATCFGWLRLCHWRDFCFYECFQLSTDVPCLICLQLSWHHGSESCGGFGEMSMGMFDRTSKFVVGSTITSLSPDCALSGMVRAIMCVAAMSICFSCAMNSVGVSVARPRTSLCCSIR